MRYTTFGHRTGLRVSEYALGTANFGTGWGAGAELDEARRIFDRFAEAGGTFLDTADTYQFGESEELTGKFISADRDHFVLAAKFALGAAPRPSVSKTGNRRKNMVGDCRPRRIGEGLREAGANTTKCLVLGEPQDEQRSRPFADEKRRRR
ncbi:aldo/keto reductase [Streptomyces sp. NBC_00503]|uniref:aldo/keto reductase n=1 Tax=Streptomyces sp. NBC_00503 TaxID=2903659 RepID=UPI002E8084BB|nr:aldo/keto reductase [Streptomyces sp. NBC_00503]WUD85641.1 aldo/keto reductase [Streptomyces sp. NBC_00503]